MKTYGEWMYSSTCPWLRLHAPDTLSICGALVVHLILLVFVFVLIRCLLKYRSYEISFCAVCSSSSWEFLSVSFKSLPQRPFITLPLYGLPFEPRQQIQIHTRANHLAAVFPATRSLSPSFRISSQFLFLFSNYPLSDLSFRSLHKSSKFSVYW
jgi:hypothetical protein